MKNNRMLYLKQRIRNFLIRAYTRCYGWFHPIEKKILFMSFGGASYSDSPRALSETMHRAYPDYKLVWCLSNPQTQEKNLPDYIEIVKGRTQFYNALATSVCFVNNFEMESNFYKRKNQMFVQTWHGDRGLKKVLHDAWEGGQRPLPVWDDKVTDICVAASDYGVQIYKSAFRYNGEILKVGTPRNDKLVNSSTQEVNALKEQMGIAKNTKILLYAPTFRDRIEEQKVWINLEKVVDILSRDGEEWKCLVRTHPGRSGHVVETERITDMSKYPDMTDLLVVSDMLITDYSSCAGDFILKKKPVILAIFDREEYEDESRELNVILENTGYILACNQSELEEILEKTSEEEYQSSAESVLQYYGRIVENGNASQIICDRIDAFYEQKMLFKG